ncbi:MAG: class I SAM-dependent methyltransferase [Lutibacter sp.]|uniref:class I SAM-dependent methyltransferase n=1 Tax=Lutibacter sp. TaxID=1925666 RepID=UPI00385A6FD5
MNKHQKYFSVNKETWNKKVGIHLNSDFYDVNGFLYGKSSLNKYELDELGIIKDKSLLHLQCHFGLDTLNLCRLGAKCTGIDISNEGIVQAKKLNDKAGLDAVFIESNVYDIPKKIAEKFDIIFTSYGVISWLPNLNTWAKIIADKLNKNGFFYMIEFHPIIWMFDYLQNPPKMIHPYLNSSVIYEEYEGTYANFNSKIISKEYNWNHGLGEVVSALTKAGLHIDYLHEFEKSPYNCFPDMEKTKDGMFEFKKNKNLFPLLFSIKATKK